MSRKSPKWARKARRKERAFGEHANAEVGCGSKRRYWSRVDAWCAAERRIGAPHGPRALRVYECEVCRGWHLTKKTPPESVGVVG